MKILILGGFGFLGKHILEILENNIEKYEYFCASRKNGFDLRDYETVKKLISDYNPKVIIQCAADVGNLNYVYDNAADVIYNNSLIYLNLYKSLSDLNLNPVIINPISNCSYPGNSDIQHEEEWWDGKIHESVLSYGGAKKFSYLLSECNKIQNKIKTINLIIPNAYGPYDHLSEDRTHAMNGLVMRMIKAQKKNENIFTVWGTGSPIREWIYMGDAAKIIEIIINKIKKGEEVPELINLGQEHGISIKESAILISKKINANFEIIFDKEKKDGAPKKVLSETNFRKFLPKYEFTSYDDGLTKTINWYKKNLI
jgi:GDP-L-fucose synthase